MVEKSLDGGKSDPQRTAWVRSGDLFMAGKREELETTMPFHTTAQITLRRAKRAKLIYKNSISAVDSQDLYEFHFIIVFI